MSFHNNFVPVVGNDPQSDGSTKVTVELDDSYLSLKIKDNEASDPEVTPKDGPNNGASDPKATSKDSSDNE
ncbi:hypothetical protein [Lactiplantibacillus pentosus]|uniref:Uncharacterized protein n=1 Tax=Lactiplantibacillus pentosus DSM 20314 TaxID=1423791 RepID=A0A837RB86_LACPE|nr:hypothetical protein [Lactiplantibacillus pentosus]AYJ42445.1 hypothetical protein LP314_11445 [Lactiplantibacillus pentosus]KRK24880.1 hypothetical protein FD24_GL003300 [Lactiplantibacillus pentosus DSM 20314]MCT3311956.1 hypothetical protein [Lactiplantibacillus pentosus]PKX55445.1 hypothetical protein BIS22_10505 [Lactiplantibacillus pentosus]TDG92023.1 hypothetical protein C5L29_002469 [Lactiplantibacillus pentosus]